MDTLIIATIGFAALVFLSLTLHFEKKSELYPRNTYEKNRYERLTYLNGSIGLALTTLLIFFLFMNGGAQ